MVTKVTEVTLFWVFSREMVFLREKGVNHEKSVTSVTRGETKKNPARDRVLMAETLARSGWRLNSNTLPAPAGLGPDLSDTSLIKLVAKSFARYRPVSTSIGPVDVVLINIGHG